jgi:hypothetical protein
MLLLVLEAKAPMPVFSLATQRVEELTVLFIQLVLLAAVAEGVRVRLVV